MFTLGNPAVILSLKSLKSLQLSSSVLVVIVVTRQYDCCGRGGKARRVFFVFCASKKCRRSTTTMVALSSIKMDELLISWLGSDAIYENVMRIIEQQKTEIKSLSPLIV